MAQRNWMVVSFYTSKYAEAAARLVSSLQHFGLKYDVQAIEDKGGWQGAVRFKPRFILEMMEKHPDFDGIVWTDADSVVRKHPALFDTITCELACFFHHWRGKNVDELLSGTMYFANTPKMRQVVKEWISELDKADKSLSCPEQYVLQQMLGDLKLNVFRLPREYCYIGRDNELIRLEPNIVFQHYQWSRECRRDKEPPPVVERVVQEPSLKKERLKKKPIITRALPVQTVTHQLAPGRQNQSLRRKAIWRRRETNRSLETIENTEPDPTIKYEPVGGVTGHQATPGQIHYAIQAISQMIPATTLDGQLKGQTVVVLGNASSLLAVDLEGLRKFPTIGCNRALKPQVAIKPNYLVIADREPYCQERDAGRLAAAAAEGVKLILSDSIFDPRVILRGPYSDPNRRAQPVPSFACYLYRIGPRIKQWTYVDVEEGKVIPPFNLKTFDGPVVSCLNVVGSVLQIAAILGAKNIISAGFDLTWPKTGPSHTFGDGKAVGAYQQQHDYALTVACLKLMKREMTKAGIHVYNVSPKKDTAFAKVWKSMTLEEAIKKIGGEESDG